MRVFVPPAGMAEVCAAAKVCIRSLLGAAEVCAARQRMAAGRSTYEHVLNVGKAELVDLRGLLV